MLCQTVQNSDVTIRKNGIAKLELELVIKTLQGWRPTTVHSQSRVSSTSDTSAMGRAGQRFEVEQTRLGNIGNCATCNFSTFDTGTGGRCRLHNRLTVYLYLCIEGAFCLQSAASIDDKQ